MSNLSKISHSIEQGSRRFIADLGKSDALLPVVLLEATVIAGRTYHAYDRGGFVEARERGTEEILGAVFWLGGVHVFNKLGDLIGKKVLGLNNIEINDGKNPAKKSWLGLEKVDFEVGKDAVRNPVLNYRDAISKQVNGLLKDGKKIPKYGEKALAAFKFTKVISSILLANAVIGFIVPKINQAITRKYQNSLEKMDYKKSSKLMNKRESFDSFINKIPVKDRQNTSFKGGVQTLLSLTNSFENDARYKLLSTDAGIAGGRAINARNKHERREILFRDLSSIYFYLFCRKNLSSVLNLIEDGKVTRLDTMSANKLDSHLRTRLKGKESYTVEEFEKLVFGNKNALIPAEIQGNIKNGIINLEDFKKIVSTDSEIAKRAERMSELQPKLEGASILTAEQVKDVYSNGLIDEPRFLNKVFKTYTEKKSTNPMKFVSEKDLRNLKQQMVDHVENIIKKSKSSGESITMETLKKANRVNFLKNAVNLGIGFAVSSYFLSTAIPKIQYWLTKKQTGEDKFPGVQKYDK